MALISKIVSGGQTGADRAALDFALAHGIPHGGWCPRGRLAEDGPIPDCYQLTETASTAYPVRTEWNVRDSDGTVIFTIGETLSGGSLKTWNLAQRHGKPVLHLSQQGHAASAAEQLRKFLETHHIRVLNAAGSRASKEPPVGDFVRKTLMAALIQSPAA